VKRLSPLQAIRRQCLGCMGGKSKFVAECPDEVCVLFPYRTGKIEPGASRSLVKMIHKYCIKCVGSANELKGCQANETYLGNDPCYLWPFRLGTNPNITRATREKRKAIAQKHNFKPMDRSKTELEWPVIA